MKTCLLIVERDFLRHHVGVRRVILHCWQELERRGYSVAVAAPDAGRLRLGQFDLARILDSASRDRSDAPQWTSTNREVRPSRFPKIVHGRWTTRSADLDDYDLTVVTNPWLCRAGLPEGKISAAIVYDMVPNLIASGALDFGRPLDVYDFAYAHDVGYRLYQDRAEKILCISESTRDDFVDLYRCDAETRKRVEMFLPYSAVFSPAPKRRPSVNGQPRLLMVNVLDPRKNFEGIRNALAGIGAEASFDIDIVGAERIALPEALRFLDELADAGRNVRWYRQASDACLARLYADADLLVFPSLYEGLGLPILEAQNHGVPVICSNLSSCPEVNMNSGLCLDPGKHSLMGAAMADILMGRGASPLQGEALQARLAEYIAMKPTFGAALGLGHAPESVA